MRGRDRGDDLGSGPKGLPGEAARVSPARLKSDNSEVIASLAALS